MAQTTIKYRQIAGGLDGWIPAEETWIYASADDPTFTFTVASDVTTKYSAGMKIKLTQGTVKYFIITAVSTYSGGNTTITVYGGTDYDLANSAISANAYSMMRTPAGFPMSPAKWSVTVVDNTLREQTSAADNTHYNMGGISISCPIGFWYASGKYTDRAIFGTGVGTPQVWTGLSTSTTGFTNTSLFLWVATGEVGNLSINVFVHSYIETTSKTTYYVVHRQSLGGSGNIARFENASCPMVLRFTCAYL